MRLFRNFALAFIAFRSNVRETLEYGRHRRRGTLHSSDSVTDESGLASGRVTAAQQQASESIAQRFSVYLTRDTVVKVRPVTSMSSRFLAQRSIN
jgi:hypothetical protein